MDISSLCIPQLVVLRYVVAAQPSLTDTRFNDGARKTENPVLSTVLEPGYYRLVSAVTPVGSTELVAAVGFHTPGHYICMYVCMCVWTVCMNVCMYGRVCVCVYVCMYVCMYACIYVRMYLNYRPDKTFH